MVALSITLPDLSPYRRGSTGVDYVTTFDSGKPGPHVLVNALTHGNEICGAQTLDWLFRRNVRPRRGRLTLSFANIGAYLRFDPGRPYESRYVDEDLNRLWSSDVLSGNRLSAELRRVRELLPFVESADYLLDLHSMHLPSAPLMLCGMQPRALALARRMGVPRHLICDPGHEAGRRMRDYGAFDSPGSRRTALLVECGQHWDPVSTQVCLETALRFLAAVECVESSWVQPFLKPLPTKPLVEIQVSGPVTIATRDFRFVREYQGLEIIPKQGTVIARDGDRDVRTPHDQCVLIMPGRNLSPGLTAVRLGRIVA